ncbi:hypothetical protein PINS_up004297 [Pythium insidiosum]|nr:hypothetical protein PINS_up004297 [Pythium insidiosum]
MAARRATAPSSSSIAATAAASPSTTATTTVHKPRVVKKARKTDDGAAVVRPTKKRKSQSAETLHDVGSAAAGSVSTPFAPVEKKTKKTKAKPVEPPTTDASYFTASQFDVEINSVDDTAEEEDGDDEEAEETQEEEEEEADGEDEEDEEEEEDEEIAAPVVFQCGTCRCIFGDSYSFVSSNAELLLVTLSAVTNVAVGPEPLTSKEGPDLGSSFLELLCKQCQTVLGRQYLTTPMALDPIRSLYSFSTSCIASYQLGYPQLSQAASGATAPPSVDEIKKANDACVDAVNVLSMDRQELLRLREEMTKVQNLLLVVDERLHDLETQADDSEEDHDEGDEQNGSTRRSTDK